MPEGSCELRSALSSVLPGSFLEIGLFLVLGAHIEVSMAEPIFFFFKKTVPGEMVKNSPKIGFLDFLGKSIY